MHLGVVTLHFHAIIYKVIHMGVLETRNASSDKKFAFHCVPKLKIGELWRKNLYKKINVTVWPISWNMRTQTLKLQASRKVDCGSLYMDLLLFVIY